MERDEEGMRLKRRYAALLLALMLALCAPCTAEQTALTVYITQGSVPEASARQLVQILQRAIPEAAFTAVTQQACGESLTELVMRDQAPHIAICIADQAQVWAAQGLLLALNTSLGDVQGMEAAVLASCMQGDEAYIAPLLLQYRQMAVNSSLLGDMGLEHLADRQAHPVWMPVELAQVLKEASVHGQPGMELWLPAAQESGGMLAMAQALYDGDFFTEAGRQRVCAGLEWLGDMVACGLIGMAGSREEALQNFLTGKTVVFADWTAADAAAQQKKGREEAAALPYPCAGGEIVRAFSVTGAAAFATGEQRTDALARAAIAVLMEDTQAQRLLGGRTMQTDSTLWLSDIGSICYTPAMRGALQTALAGVLSGEMSEEAAMQAAAAASRVQ